LVYKNGSISAELPNVVANVVQKFGNMYIADGRSARHHTGWAGRASFPSGAGWLFGGELNVVV
jgi:hypothetical protein